MPKTGQFTLQTLVPTLIATGNGRDVLIHNTDATNAAVVGDLTVTAATGFQVDATAANESSATVRLPLGPGEKLYAVAVAGTPKLFVYQQL